MHDHYTLQSLCKFSCVYCSMGVGVCICIPPQSEEGAHDSSTAKHIMVHSKMPMYFAILLQHWQVTHIDIYFQYSPSICSNA